MTMEPCKAIATPLGRRGKLVALACGSLIATHLSVVNGDPALAGRATADAF